MNIAVVGTGYVGLVSGTCFAETGNNVYCVDIDETKVKRMRNGEVPIYEPGLEVLLERNVRGGRLHFTTSLEEGIKDAEIIFLALPTPPGADGEADLSFVLKVASDLSELIQDYKVIVDKSTVPVGTAQKVHDVLAEKLNTSMFDVVSNPEFLREGVAVEDFLRPDRVVIGSSSERARKTMKRLYEPFLEQGSPIIMMDEKSAELTKYAANSFLATKITFMNEIANICDLLGADVDMVRKGIGSDARIGSRFLFAGIGYGGSCFPKDVKALLKTSSDYGYDFKILHSVTEVNANQKMIPLKILRDKLGNIEDKKIAVWGLSFKPNTDDIREAPALIIVDELLESGADVHVYDPEAMSNVKRKYGDRLTYSLSMYDALQDAEALIIATEWSVFKTPRYNEMKRRMALPLVIDGRNIYKKEEMTELNFDYHSIGRP